MLSILKKNFFECKYFSLNQVSNIEYFFMELTVIISFLNRRFFSYAYFSKEKTFLLILLFYLSLLANWQFHAKITQSHSSGLNQQNIH